MEQRMIEDEMRILMESEGGQRVVLDKVVLNWPIHRLKPRQPPLTFEVGSSVGDAVRRMRDEAVGNLLVLDQGELVGIITERDIVRKVAAAGRLPDDLRVEEIMTPEPERLNINDPLIFALNKMAGGGFRHLPLTDDDGLPVATLSMRSMIRFLVDYFAQEAFTVPPEPGSDVAQSREGA